MESKNKIWRAVPLLVCGSVYAYKLSSSFEKAQEMDSYVFLAIAAVGFSCYAWIIHVDVDEYLRTKEYTSFIPTAVGVGVISFVTALYAHHHANVNSPTLIKAFYEGENHGLEIDLKKNGHFMMSKENERGQSFYYGKYTIKDSVISFEPSGKHKNLPAQQLVIRKVMDIDHLDNEEGLDTAYSDYLLMKGNSDKMESENYYFKVVEDRRSDEDKDSSTHEEQKKIEEWNVDPTK